MSGERDLSAFPPESLATDLDAKIVAALERVSHVMQRALWDSAWSHGVSPSQAQFLVYLLFYGQQQSVRVGDLSRRFGLRHSTVSDAVRALEAKGYLERTTDPQDRRVTVLRLTPAGKSRAAVLSRWAEQIRQLLASMDPQKKSVFLATLLELTARFQESGLISVSRTCTTCHYFVSNRYPNPQAPHHCNLLNRPLALVDLQVECPDHRGRANG